MVLSREDAGAEQIFRNDGVRLIHTLLQSKQEDIVLSALRTLVGLCTGHQSRVSCDSDVYLVCLRRYLVFNKNILSVT